MRKVLLLIDFLGQGGAERQMVYLASEFKRNGFDVRLIKFFEDDGAYSEMLKANGIRVELDLKGSNKWKRILRIRKFVKEWKPDLTIAYKDGTCIAASLARIFTDFRLAVSERNTTQNNSFFENLKFNTYRLAEFIIPNSNSQAQFIRSNYPILSNKIRVISNMVDITKFFPAKMPMKHKRVLLVARLTEQKNILNFIEALSIGGFDSKEIHFDWYGKIQSKEYFNKVVERVKSLCLEDLITFHTEGSTHIEEEYRKSTHFCLPSYYEGFPNALCEAMACGLVCTASNVCDNPEIINDSKMLFDPNDPEGIAHTIRFSLSLSEDERLKIGVRNRERILSMASPDIFIGKYLELY